MRLKGCLQIAAVATLSMPISKAEGWIAYVQIPGMPHQSMQQPKFLVINTLWNNYSATYSPVVKF